jgi:RNA polymerase sigma factor (sigma-70 family)
MDERERRFRALYGSARPRLLAYALRRTRSPDDAADVVAETFLIAWRRLDDVPQGDGALLWLFATCRNVIAAHGRRALRRTELSERIGSELRSALRDDSQPDSDALLAASALSRLSEEDRELLLLVGWDGLDSKELATVLGCSPTAARIRLHRARARLRAEMGQHGVATKHSPSRRHSLLQEQPPEDTEWEARGS